MTATRGFVVGDVLGSRFAPAGWELEKRVPPWSRHRAKTSVRFFRLMLKPLSDLSVPSQPTPGCVMFASSQAIIAWIAPGPRIKGVEQGCQPREYHLISVVQKRLQKLNPGLAIT